MKTVDFEYFTKYGTFKSALVLDDNSTFSDEEIEALKVKEVNNWIAIMDGAATNTQVQ